MKVLTIGGATQDVFVLYSDEESMHLQVGHETQSFTLLRKGSKIEVDKLHYATGGGATNSAVSFQRLGLDACAFFKIANDTQGTFVLNQLSQENVSTNHLITHDTCTGISLVIPSFEGDRTIFAYRGANATIKESEIPTELIKTADHLYITSLSGESSQLLLLITQLAKQHGIPVANNPGKSQLLAGADILQKSLPNIDILILNDIEAQQLMLSLVQTSEKLKSKIHQEEFKKEKNSVPELLKLPITIENICFNLRHFFTEILESGPRIVVVTNGQEGVYVATKDIIYFHPSIPAEVVNTIGAGDAFGSCFVASIIEDSSIEQAIVNGIINASSAISHLDAKTGLLNKNALEQQAAKVGTQSVRTFKP